MFLGKVCIARAALDESVYEDSHTEYMHVVRKCSSFYFHLHHS